VRKRHLPLPPETLRGCHVHRRATVLAGGFDDLRFGKAMGRGSLGMTAKVIQFRDYQNPKDIERLRQQMAAEILSQIDTSPSEMIPYHGAGIDGMKFEAPPEDCA
jgi:hypothetical protein